MATPFRVRGADRNPRTDTSEASPEGACERACERGEKYLKSRGRKIRTGSIGQAGVYTEGVRPGDHAPPVLVKSFFLRWIN